MMKEVGSSPLARSRPQASSVLVHRRMTRTGQRDTPPELALRRALHAQGLRYRVDVRPFPGCRSRPDILFPGAKLAVFVDGCFWHGCPEHATWPKTNASWWKDKIEANRSRDQAARQQMAERGWAVLTVWEHEDVGLAAVKVAGAVAKRKAMSSNRD